MEIDDLELYLLNIKKLNDKVLEKSVKHYEEDQDIHFASALSNIEGRVAMLDIILEYIKNNK